MMVVQVRARVLAKLLLFGDLGGACLHVRQANPFSMIVVTAVCLPDELFFDSWGAWIRSPGTRA